MPWPKTGATHYHAHFDLPDKSRAINWLVVCFSWDVIAFRPALHSGSMLLSPEVLISIII